MDIEHCLDIFYGEYLNRHAEFDLPQAEALALLERRYPQGEVLAGKIPTLNDRVKDRLASLAAPEAADGDLLDAGGVIKLFRQAYFEYRLSGYAFCERLYALLQEKEPGIGRHLGPKVEALARTFFERRGIVYHTGYYIGEDGKTQECDMILEDEKNILFIEIKKRPLREGFLQANDVEIFQDLAYGMLSAQIQAKKHLKALVQNGSIPLYRDAKGSVPCYTLRLDGRKVKTMSVCLPEYAFLTQAFLAERFMGALLRGSFHSLDPAQEGKLNKLNQLAGEYRDLIEELKKISPADPREYNHFSYFRSLQQVWLALQSCGTAGEAIKKLTWDDHLIFESVDFYSGLQAQDRWR